MSLRGAGTAFARRVLSNADVLLLLGNHQDAQRREFAAAGLQESLGVAQRSWAHQPGQAFAHGEEETSLSLSIAAAEAALTNAGLKGSDLGLVLCSTSTPHRMTSTLSAPLGAQLGAQCACMDVRTGCAAGLFSLATASLYLRAGVGPILLVGADTFSKVIPPGQKMASLSMGDGAGALVLDTKASASLRGIFLQTDGSLGRLITTDGALPPTSAEIERGGYVLSGSPEELAAALPGKYQEALTRVLARAQVPANSVDLFVPHQTSRPLITEVARRVGFAEDKVFINVHRHANIGVAGWIVALAEAFAEQRLGVGKTVALAAVGGGMSWGAALWTL